MLELKRKELKEAQDNLEITRTLVKKGFVPFEQIRVLELAVQSKQFEVSQGEEELGVLEEYDRRRKIAELYGEARETERKLERTKKSQKAATAKSVSEAESTAITARLEKQTLDCI